MPKTTSPQAQRARLKKELQSATGALYDLTERFREAERAQSQIDKKRIAAYSNLARGDREAQQDVDALEEERREALAEADRLRAALEGATRARREAERDLAMLYAEHLSHFAEEADGVTQEAVAALAALAEPYKAARDAWRRAELAWEPLQPAIKDALTRANQDAGVYPSGGELEEQSRVPGFPLPDATHVFIAAGGEVAPRPPALEPKSSGDPTAESLIRR